MSNAIDRHGVSAWLYNIGFPKLADAVIDKKRFPPVQPEIIKCEDCRHNGSFDTDCPIDWNGKEYCSFAERREV